MIALSALLLALLVVLLLAWSYRGWKVTRARADNEPGAAGGTLLIICTGDTRASLETCS